MLKAVLKAFKWIRVKRLTPVLIFFLLLAAMALFVFFTEGAVVLPAIYRLIP